MQSKSNFKNCLLYVITDEKLGQERSHYEIAKLAIAGGADIIQLRDKSAPGKKMYEDAVKIRKLTGETGTIFIVNDRVDIALASDADGVHVGQNDLPASIIRKLIGDDKILGVSAESVDDAVRAKQDGADYLGVGPVYEARGSKPDTSAPWGLRLLKDVRAAVDLPIVAIGGIKYENAAEVIRAGAHCVSVISAVVSASDIRKATADLRQLIENERSRRDG
ncbi:thiamine phosphate synthase [candidate division KSB1 bacterium]|nr:thiamine phosphate synthase [candidate division KSB1 bacterium]